MSAPNPQIILDKEDAAKLELYRLFGEGVRAVQNIFYIYIESSDIVYIVRILYSKADWENILLRYQQ